MSEPVDYTTRVTGIWSPTETTRAVRLARPEGFIFQACQAVRLILDGPAGETSRSLSLAAGPDRGHLELAARISDSDFKRAFFSLQPGDPVRIRGPLGRFILDRGRPAVMLAGGIGITPFRSMLQFVSDNGASQRIMLIYASREPREIAFKQEIDELAGNSPGVEILYIVSAAEQHDNRQYRLGRIDPPLLQKIAGEIPGAVYYLAGPVDFVRALIGELRLLGIPKADLRAEAFRGYAFEDAVPALNRP
jgi:ferredoxin-NADP reductase